MFEQAFKNIDDVLRKDAVADLGKADQIREVFTGFQKYLYRDVA